jgi:hypothetical protein
MVGPPSYINLFTVWCSARAWHGIEIMLGGTGIRQEAVPSVPLFLEWPNAIPLVELRTSVLNLLLLPVCGSLELVCLAGATSGP